MRDADRSPTDDAKTLGFISEAVDVDFGGRKVIEKRAGCPDAFVWRGTTYVIVERLAEWHDYSRRGRMAHNMRPSHARAAESRGSFGVGRDYYRVRTDAGRVFDLYYDRAPKDTVDRKGGWYLLREMEAP